MSERSAEEQAAAAALREAVEALTGAALRADGIASDIAAGAGERAADALFDALCSTAARLREAETALGTWTSRAATPDGAYVDGYNRLTHGYRWHVVRDGVIVARGWSDTEHDAQRAAQAAWGQGDGEA